MKPDCNKWMTDSMGHPIPNDMNSLTVGPEGPILMEDVHFLDKMGHFDRERIPERVVHAKGVGAYGVFQPYRCMAEYTMADFLQSPGKKTKTFVRISTVIGSKGSADTERDPRGFAVKFYTEQGNYDLVGNDIPVFFIRDSIKFPDLIHSLKPRPDSNLKDPERFWDFASLMPETTHMVTWLYSDRGTVKDYRKIEGFGVNTYVWVNREGRRRFIKYHWKSMQGIETISRQEAEYLAGADPNIATRILQESIARGDYPSWQLCVQLMDPEEADHLPFDPLDDTKVWPEDRYPLMPVGVMTLNENPKSFFAETEQSAFCPANLVPGVELSDDKMLQGRAFSYIDTQRHRIGPNFMQLPVNRAISPINNNQREGDMEYWINPNPINYSPNTLSGNVPLPANIPVPPAKMAKGKVVRQPITKTDDFTQAGERFRSFTRREKEVFVDNIAVELAVCKKDIVDRVLHNFAQASMEWARMEKECIMRYKRKDNTPIMPEQRDYSFCECEPIMMHKMDRDK